MRTKREFYVQVKQKVEDTLKTLQDLTKEVSKIDSQMKSGRYVDSYIKETLLPQKRSLERQIADTRLKANMEIKDFCDEYIEELKSEDNLDPSKLTEDINLLKPGIKLKERDIKAMLERNADNHTMTQIILRYCEENGIDSGVVNFNGNQGIINNVSVIPTTVETSLKWSDKQATVYERLMGEGSELESAFVS